MSLTYNGAEVKEIIYNGNALKQMDYNGVTVFKKDEWSDKPYIVLIEENGTPFSLWMYRRGATETSGTYVLNDGTFEYSKNGVTWNQITSFKKGNASTRYFDITNTNIIYLRGLNNTKFATNSEYTNLVVTTSGAKVNVYGNIENLLDYSEVSNGRHPAMSNNGFRSMFYNSKIYKAPELPATTLADSCYKSMFSYCSNLTTAPELPATTLADNCYSSMFKGCTSLTGQIHLPASVSSNSYRLQDSDISGSSATIVFDL